MNDPYNKLKGWPRPGSTVRAVNSFGHAFLGYIFVPAGAYDGDDPSMVVLDGWVHFPRLEAGDGTNSPLREPLETFLNREEVEQVTVTGDPQLGEEYAWLPGCPDCEAIGEGVVMVYGIEPLIWGCGDCNARFEKPIRREVPELMKTIAKISD